MTAKQPLKLVQGNAVIDWRDRISAAYQKTVESYIETGRLLVAAKDVLAHGTFTAMVKTDLPFGPRTARMLMTIAADERISKRNHGSVLPASWRTLHELTKLPDKIFDAKIKDGTINPKMERKDVAAMLGKTPEPAAPLKWSFADANMRILEAIEREFNRYGALPNEAPIIAYILREHAKGLVNGTDEPNT